MELSSSIIEQFQTLDASVAATRKLFKIKDFADTLSVHALARLHGNPTYPTSARFCPQRIYKHGSPSQTDTSTRKACLNTEHMAFTVKQTRASRESYSFGHVFCTHALEMDSHQ